jgi:hypothetical protein
MPERERERERPFERYIPTWEDNINISYRELRYEDID